MLELFNEKKDITPIEKRHKKSKIRSLQLRKLGQVSLILFVSAFAADTADAIEKKRECIEGEPGANGRCVSGYGVMKTTSGTNTYLYQGGFDNSGNRHDCDTKTTKNGNPFYEGPFLYDKKDTSNCPDTEGVFHAHDGGKYVGKWENGLPNGQGIEYFPNGGRYEGKFKDGFAHGQGTEYYPDGYRYTGPWYKGKKHGKGVRTSPDGIESCQKWEHGEFITSDSCVASLVPTISSRPSTSSTSCSVQDISPSSDGKCGTCSGGSYPGETVCATYYSGGWNTVGGYGGHATDYWEALNNACCRR